VGLALSFTPDFGRYWQAYLLATWVIGPHLFGLLVTGIQDPRYDPSLPDPTSQTDYYSDRVLAFMIANFAALRLQFRWMAALQLFIVGSSAWTAHSELPAPGKRLIEEYAALVLPVFLRRVGRHRQYGEPPGNARGTRLHPGKR
jgi:hypothetical protein